MAGLLFGSMALVDLLAVNVSSRHADAVGDLRVVIVPGILGASVKPPCLAPTTSGLAAGGRGKDKP